MQRRCGGMVYSWRWRRRQPANLWLYGGLSLVIHGAVFLAWQWTNPTVEERSVAELPPIEIVEAPKVVAETPPPDTEHRAVQHAIAQGTARPDLPLGVETTRRSAERVASQPAPALSPRSDQASPNPEPLPRPVAPQELSRPKPEEPTPSPTALREPQPTARTEPQIPTPPVLPESASTPKRPALRAFQPPSHPNAQPAPHPAALPKGEAALLGGPISRDARQAPFDQEANSTRNAPGPTQLAARQDVDLGPYLANLRRRVQQNWRPRAPDQPRQTVVGFTLSRSGQISNLRVLRSSGSPQTDAETLEAIQRAAPFGPLPETFAYNQLEIEFTFNIYVNNVVIQAPRSWYGF
ncbi:MAG: TonB family protein [Gloeomargarita sp. SKYBB_i_bin120]|nr:TonB family protein [Gloeomargarita sp. SKYG98]MCS7291725.1 TonB family protein [Gloeomargarita sp. SKYB120]MDW8177284.1 TonB family protein [Gloeomargarita sp. SKYBB_i_bin120]